MFITILGYPAGMDPTGMDWSGKHSPPNHASWHGYMRPGRALPLFPLLVALCILCAGLPGSSFPGAPSVEAGSAPNPRAVLEVRYSPTRYSLSPEWREGVIEIELFERRAPITTANFMALAESGFYDGTLFHRVINDFVIQGGCPNTRGNRNQLDWWDDGSGGSEETIPLESHPELTHVDGAVGMARELGDPDSASSQFYICDGPQPGLDDTEENNRNRTLREIDDRGYAVFGVTVSGMEVVRDIALVWTTTDLSIDTVDPLPAIRAHYHDHPIYDVLLKRVTIIRFDAGGDDNGITLGQAAATGALIFVAVGAVMIGLLRKGRLPGARDPVTGVQPPSGERQE